MNLHILNNWKGSKREEDATERDGDSFIITRRQTMLIDAA